MTEQSYNGWPASKTPALIKVVPLEVAGVTFVGGIREGDVHTVLSHVLGEFDSRVEELRPGQCFGYAFRPNRNDPNELSNHASATAADANSLKHPNGVDASKTFTKAQINECHKILAEIPELAEVVHWGGDWHETNHLTPDPMHWEIHDHDLAKLARVAARIEALQEDPMLALLADLKVLAKKHGVSLVYIARVALFGSKSTGARKAAVAAARALLKPFK